MKPKKRRTNRAISTAEDAVLKELRKAQGLSMRELGKLIGRSDSYILHIETGRLNMPTDETLRGLLNIYGCTNIEYIKGQVSRYEEKLSKKENFLLTVEKMSERQIEFLSRISGLLLL